LFSIYILHLKVMWQGQAAYWPNPASLLISLYINIVSFISFIIHLAVCNFWQDKKSYLLAALYKKLVTLQSYQLFTERTVTNFLQSAQSALS
jgi:hypothetical protein